MVRLQSPASQIFRPAQTVSAADVAAEGFSPMAAIEANHIIVAYGLANRDSRGECFFGKGLLPEPAKASVDDRDEIRKLTCSDVMVSQVTPNDFRGEWPMTVFGFHGSLPGTIFCFAL
jgi:hypothetical protein